MTGVCSCFTLHIPTSAWFGWTALFDYHRAIINLLFRQALAEAMAKYNQCGF